MTRFALALAFSLTVLALPAADGARPPADEGLRAGGGARFEADTKRITGRVRRKITGSSWRRGCPVSRSRLRLIRATHWDFAGEVERGALIVHRNHKRRMVRVLRELFEERFPIRKMNLIDRYGSDDHRSMDADNTSAFNCRYVNGTTRWSMHAFGKAIDINPVENPYVSGGHVSPPAGAPYADRSRDAKGMIHRGDDVYRAFRGVGWRWGGDWSGARDYQHFSSNGE
jgi:hypothetical protein